MKLKQVVEEKDFHVSTARLRSVSRGGGLICPLLSISTPDLWKLWRENCHLEICTAKARAVGMAVPSTMHHLACYILSERVGNKFYQAGRKNSFKVIDRFLKLLKCGNE